MKQDGNSRLTKDECDAVVATMKKLGVDGLVSSASFFDVFTFTSFKEFLSTQPQAVALLAKNANGDRNIEAFIRSLEKVNSMLIELTESSCYFENVVLFLEALEKGMSDDDGDEGK